MKKNKIIVNSFCLLLFFIIMLLVILKQTSSFDSFIYQLLINFRCPVLDSFFKTITVLGNKNMIIITLLLFILLFHDKKALVLVINVFSCIGLNSLIKHIIRRPRPSVKHLIKQGGFSFPSGHAMICLYGYLLYLVHIKIKNKWLKLLLEILLLFIIISIGLSRIYVGVHYPTDIIAGYCLAYVISNIIIYSTNDYFKGV